MYIMNLLYKFANTWKIFSDVTLKDTLESVRPQRIGERQIFHLERIGVQSFFSGYWEQCKNKGVIEGREEEEREKRD